MIDLVNNSAHLEQYRKIIAKLIAAGHRRSDATLLALRLMAKDDTTTTTPEATHVG